MVDHEQAQKAASTAMDQILKEEERRPKIPESEFRRALLPMIANTENEDMSLWLKVAGSWQRPVDVFDDGTNEVLFTIPPLVERTTEPMRQSGPNSAYDVVMDSARKMNISSMAGEDHLNRSLLPRIRPQGDRSTNIQRWNEIYRRYGLDHLLINEDGSSESTTESKESLDIEEYEDL